MGSRGASRPSPTARSPRFRQAQRQRVETQYRHGALSRFTETMAAWIRGGRLDRASFARRFFGRDADDPLVERLHGAALVAGLKVHQQ